MGVAELQEIEAKARHRSVGEKERKEERGKSQAWRSIAM